MSDSNVVVVYRDPETDEFTVSCEDFDDFSTFDEIEAMNEAFSIAEEIDGTVVVRD